MRCVHGETGICWHGSSPQTLHCTARPLKTTKSLGPRSCGPEETPPAQGYRVPGPENKTPLCGDFLWWVGGGHSLLVIVAAGQTTLSQLMLHLSYVVRRMRDICRSRPHQVESQSNPAIEVIVPYPTLMLLCVPTALLCCLPPSVLGKDSSPAPQAPTRQVPLPRPSPARPALEPSQPPGPLDRRPCHTYRDPTSRPLLFGLDAGCRDHYGTTMAQGGKQQTH